MSSFSSLWESLKVEKLTGESQVSHGAVFTDDSKYLLVPCGHHIKVYSRETGCVVNVLSHHDDTVTHIVLGQTKSMKVYTSSLDGHIAIWDYTDGGLLKSLNIGRPILYFCLTSKGTLFYVTKDDHNSNYMIISVPNLFHTKKSLSDVINNSTSLLMIDTPITKFHTTFDESHLVAFSHRTLYIHALETDHTIEFTTSHPITTCSCHPSQHCIATGDSIGQILLWYNYCKGEESVVTMTKLHWHAHAVSDLCFSTDGTNLLSGGEEGVLVVWTLATGSKHFRPRLGAPIVGVACCQGDHTFAVSLANNAILLVSGYNSEILHTLVSLYRSLPGMSYTERFSTGLVYDPHSKSLVLNGLPGQLQFIDVERLSVRQQLEVVPLNYFSRTDDKSVTPTTVDWAEFSPEGVWLATIESWDSKELSPECKLKFWKFDTTCQRYMLNTSIDPPHDGTVTSLIFRPTYLPRNGNESHESKNENESMNENESSCDDEYDDDDLYLSLVVTTGMDGKFKVWCPDTSNRMVAWDCLSVGQYYNQPCYGASFSEDGSILAVNFGKYVTLWKNPLSLELIQVLNSPITNDKFCNMCFGHSDSSHYLFMSSYHHLHLWNLLTFDIELIMPASVDVLASDPYSNNVAVFNSKTTKGSTSVDLMIVSPLCPKPLATYKNISTSPIQSALFLPIYNDNGITTSQLYFMDKTQLLYSVVSCDKSDEERSPYSFLLSENVKRSDTNRRWFNELFGQNKKSTLSATTPQTTVPIGGDKNTLISPLSLPPMNTYCKSYLSSLLPKTPSVSNGVQSSIGKEEVESSSEEEEDEEDTDGHQMDMIKMDVSSVVENEEVDSRKLDHVLVGKFDWLTEFFRTIV